MLMPRSGHAARAAMPPHGLAHPVHFEMADRLPVTTRRTGCARRAVAVLMIVAAGAGPVRAQSVQALTLRGHAQWLHVYGPADGPPVVVSSGDGGWIHLGPRVAEWLAGRGYFVVGFDARAYLAGFTSNGSMLHISDEPADYGALAAFASKATGRKPILIGVSEGAGLSVLAATDPDTKARIAGVIALGLTNVNELGWRWKDALTYLTHRPPNEPAFTAVATVAGVAPLPLALLQSTHDEFVTLADTRRIFDHASAPKRIWLIEAADHRFSDNLATFDARLLEAIEWVRQNQPR
jgi:alpha-beta hydrolase superfamily lysophospholipase